MYKRDAPADFSPLIVTYEIRSLNDDQLLFETIVDVPRRDVIITDRKNTSDLFHQRNDRFSIETSISTTLMEVMIGSTLLKLSVNIEESGPKFQYTKHILEFLRDHSGFKRPQSSQSLWKLFLSPGAEYLLLLRDGGATPTSPNSFTVDIFQDPWCRRSPMKSNFVWVAWKTITVSSLPYYVFLR